MASSGSKGKKTDAKREKSVDRKSKVSQQIDLNNKYGPELLQQAFSVFSKASKQLEQSYEDLKVRADMLAKELAQTNAELQRQLEEKEQISNFLNNILESIRSGIIALSGDGTVVLANQVAENMFCIQGNPEGKLFTDFLENTLIIRFFQECLDLSELKPRYQEIDTAAQGKSGREIFKINFAPVFDRGGKKVASLFVVQDITRLKLLEEQSLRTNRLAAMGEMAAQLAHEIRNPLGSIEIFAALLSRDLDEGPNKKLAENIVVGVKSLNSVVTNTLTFTRSVTINPELLDFNDLVIETLGFLDQVLKVQGIELVLDFSDEVGKAEIDSELIKQVLLNLAQNSIFALEGSQNGILKVSTAIVTTEEGRQAIELKVADNGCGIPKEDLPRIFDPFFTTRKGGTGLGLSVVSQIIEKHNGMITTVSELGKGTTIHLLLPPRQKI